MTLNYPQRRLGDDLVSAQGLGCMGMSFGYSSGEYDEEKSFQVLTRAADLGITFWDTSEYYGPYANEELIGRWFKATGRRDEIFLATKFVGLTVNGVLEVDCSPEYVKKACADSLKRLQTDRIDLYYQHRMDPKTPVEKTIQAMSDLKEEGNIRYLGMSECSAQSLQRACKVHPIAAAQMEYSPFALEIESEQTDFLRTARELGVKIIPYSPLGRGFLTGAIKTRDDFEDGDIRKSHPRFSEENFNDNLELVDILTTVAKEKNCTTGQLVLAWVLAQGEDFIPIPGTKRVRYLEEIAAAVEVNLSKEDEARVRQAIDSVGGTKGARYPPQMLAMCFADTPELE